MAFHDLLADGQADPCTWMFGPAVQALKNPKDALPAARYIDTLRLKGKKIGGAQISEKHANFIINLKDAKGSDILRLMELVKRRVKARFGVKLEPEIKIV